MKKRAAISLVMAFTPLPAAAAQEDTPTTPNPVVVTGTPSPAPRQICRRVGAMSGSHVSRVRICKTAAEWRALSDTSSDDVMDTLSTLGNNENRPAGGYTSSRGGGLPPH